MSENTKSKGAAKKTATGKPEKAMFKAKAPAKKVTAKTKATAKTGVKAKSPTIKSEATPKTISAKLKHKKIKAVKTTSAKLKPTKIKSVKSAAAKKTEVAKTTNAGKKTQKPAVEPLMAEKNEGEKEIQARPISLKDRISKVFGIFRG